MVADSTAGPGIPLNETVASAQAIAQGVDVVADAATTATERTVAHPDGTLTTTFDNEPVRMQNSSGSAWVDISTDLVPKNIAGEQVLVPEAAPAEITLGNGGSAHMATVSDKEGHAIEQSWPFGVLPAPSVSGNVATYAQVLPDVDLVQIAGKTGVSQVLKIYTPTAAQDPRVIDMRVYLDAHNAIVSGDGKGGLTAKGTDSGQIELTSSQGLWWDSKDPAASAQDAGNNALPRPFNLSVSTQNGQQVQRFDMAPILASENLSYPLYVDPDWTAAKSGYLYVDSGYPTYNYWNGAGGTDGSGHVGYLAPQWGGPRVTRTFYQFNTAGMAGKKIIAARMNVREVWASSCTARPVEAWTTGGVGTGTTWNTQPGWSQKVSTQNVAYGNSASCPAASVGFDMGAAKAGIATDSQWTVGLKASDETDLLGWKRFESAAILTVTHDLPPNTPTAYTISGGLWTGTPGTSTYVTRYRNPLYTVRSTDPDSGDTITVTMVIRNSAGTAVYTGAVNSSGGFAARSFGNLADGKYTWEATAKDQRGYSSGTMKFAFTVDTTPPSAPVVTPVTTGFDASHNAPSGVVGATEYDFKISNEAGKYAANGFVYSVTAGPPASTFPLNLSCDNRTNEYVVVCPSGGRVATVHLAAIDRTTTITAWAFDEAGNVGNIVKGSASAYTFTVGNLAPKPETVIQASLSGAASMVDVEIQAGVPVGSSCQGGLPADSDVLNKGKAFQFTATGDSATTATAAVDTSKSFSVSTWFCASNSLGTAQSMITQQAGIGSPGAALRLATNGVVGLETFTGANSTGMEAVNQSQILSNNTWYFASAVYDRVNRQLRLTWTTDGRTTTWTVATTAAAHRASVDSQPVILGAGVAGSSRQFIGQLYQPVMTQGVLVGEQFAAAQAEFKGEVGVLK